MSTEEVDIYLKERATELIEGDATISIDNLRIHAETGVLRLAGEASTESDRDRAGVLARSVRGSVAVANDIRVKATETDRDRPADSSSADQAPDGWVENYRDTQSTPHRSGEQKDQQ
ncbi:BON domain protein [Planctomycetes bacterium Poly30]|uniref:BON domain protein n=1 Tax=Saltatorellus ferox TaxID=2528018 RepID=A0A518EUX9_9BACT|nr:BON domain protein [Planctomycetes bacterium Poly30]